jgi:serine/threonine protein phosphatase PrpC
MNNFFYQQASTSDYEVKSHTKQAISYNELQYKIISSNENKSKSEKFKERLNEFSKINTLLEAKELLNKIMPVAKERTKFYVGDAKCIIICNEKLLKITVDTPNEFINYSFV